MAKETKQQFEALNVTRDELVPYIKKHGIKLHEQIVDAMKKYGARYNYKNRAEEMIRSFGDPKNNPEKYADEFFFILQKTSQLPASVRETVRDICNAAYVDAFYDKLNKMRDREAASAQAEQPAPKKKRASKKTPKQTEQ